ARKVDIMVPLGRMEEGPPERSKARNIGNGRPVQRPYRRNEDLDRALAQRARGIADRDGPVARITVVDGLYNLAAKADVASQPEPVGHADKITQQLSLQAEGALPVGIGREGKRVDVAGDVDARAGILVLIPGAADLVVLFDDLEGDSGILE